MFGTSLSSCLLSQREFLVVRLSLTEFLTSLLPYKACNLSQFLGLVTVYLLTTCNHYYYCKCDVLFSITSIFGFMFIILFVATATLDGLPSYRTVLNYFHLLWLYLLYPLLGWLCRLPGCSIALHLHILLLALYSTYIITV